MPPHTRRHFVRVAASAALAAPFALARSDAPEKDALPPICIFSKHLQFLDYQRMAEKAAEIGFAGIDLTVRPNGHVEPENVARDLPRAVRAARAAGLEIPLITTAVDDASSALDRELLATASDLGIPHYRMNWFPYPESESIPNALARYQQRVKELSSLNRELGIVGSYQNHAGNLVGASLWEIWQLLQGAHLSHMGIQYDIRHATVEGGLSWPNGLRLALPHIKTIVLKDFRWSMREGKATVVNTPIGEGMVDFNRYFRVLKENAIKVPMSLHLEYDIGGAEWGKTKLSGTPNAVYAAMSQDLERLRELWASA